MNKNMGMADRIARVIVALVIGGLIYTEVVTGTIAMVLGVLAIVFLFTSFIAVCPLYLPLKISTKK